MATTQTPLTRDMAYQAADILRAAAGSLAIVSAEPVDADFVMWRVTLATRMPSTGTTCVTEITAPVTAAEAGPMIAAHVARARAASHIAGRRIASARALGY